MDADFFGMPRGALGITEHTERHGVRGNGTRMETDGRGFRDAKGGIEYHGAHGKARREGEGADKGKGGKIKRRRLAPPLESMAEVPFLRPSNRRKHHPQPPATRPIVVG